MVDAAASFDGNRIAANEAPARAPTSRQARLTAAASDGAGLADYAEFCASALFAPAQSASWVRNWAAETQADMVVATLDVESRSALSLALEVVRNGPFRVARFAGGRHANGAVLGDDHPMRADGQGSAQQRAEVLRVLQAVQSQ